MSTPVHHVSVCVPTYKRPDLLKQLLDALATQETEGLFTFSVVIADNDEAESARTLVEGMSRAYPVPLKYCVEPRRSISHVRNKTIAESQGDAIAFIDDDEFPERGWLLNLYKAWRKHGVAGVLGPVRPFFTEGAPTWLQRGGFYNRPEHETGFEMHWLETRTGNVIFDRAIIRGLDPVFLPQYGSGGGDQDFFRRMIEAGHRFIWCNEAIVHEVVPATRWKRGFLLKRALLRGRNSWRHPSGRLKGLVKSLVATPLYTLALPFLLIAGHHLFMRYLVKLCDHLGRLLAALGLNPVKERAM